MNMKLIGPLLVSIACICASTSLLAKPASTDGGYYTTKDKEYYLSTEELIFIRPGLDIEILDVVLPADMQLEVTYSITDPAGLPLDHDGVATPGTVDMRFTLANIPMGEEQKVRLAYERISQNGMLTKLGPGKYKYKFETVLTSDLDTTHTLVLGGRRDLREFNLDRYTDNDLQNWVPSGMYDVMPRDVVSTETCNRCHDPLAMHGSRWLSPAACGQCHNPALFGRRDGLSKSLNVIIHQVHNEMGHNFPPDINDCKVCHTGGTPTEAFPMVATPVAALVCDASGNGKTTLSWEYTADVAIYLRNQTNPDGKLFATGNKSGSVETGKWVKDGAAFDIYDYNTMELLQTVVVNTTVLGCLGNAPGTPRGVPATQHTNWMDHPSRLVCGSCHDYIDWETGEGHSDLNLPQTSDELCSICHEATGREFGTSVAGAHQVVYKSAQLAGILIEIKSVTNTNPGDKPTVTFSMKTKNQGLSPADMDFFRLVIAGPNEDFSFLAEEFATSAVKAGDYWTYTFNTPLPADATGSFTAGAEAFEMVSIDTGGGQTLVRETAENDVFVFAVTDDEPIARRTVVNDALCENCHSNLALHGTIRHEPQYCVTCHQPAATDIGEVQEGNEEQGIHFKYMVHKIHRGADLVNGYIVAGHNQSIHDYSHVEYPGDLRNCDACHVGNSQQVPDSAGLLPTATPQDWWDPTMPTAAACLSCHDDDSSAAHAYSNTTFFGESCGTCHGEGKSAAVDKVHAH